MMMNQNEQEQPRTQFMGYEVEFGEQGIEHRIHWYLLFSTNMLAALLQDLTYIIRCQTQIAL